jgi:hypothetical protein
MLSRSGEDLNHDIYNTLIREQWRSMGADGLVDFAADPNIGADGASASTAYFNTDKTHPISTTDINIIAPLISNEINRVFGLSGNYSPTYTTSTNYNWATTGSVPNGTTFLQVDPANASGNMTVTLPTAVGYDGQSLTLQNISTSGANTLSVVSTSSVAMDAAGTELLNGTTTAYIVPSGTTVTFTSVLAQNNGSYVSNTGANWIVTDYGPANGNSTSSMSSCTSCATYSSPSATGTIPIYINASGGLSSSSILYANASGTQFGIGTSTFPSQALLTVATSSTDVFVVSTSTVCIDCTIPVTRLNVAVPAANNTSDGITIYSGSQSSKFQFLDNSDSLGNYHGEVVFNSRNDMAFGNNQVGVGMNIVPTSTFYVNGSVGYFYRSITSSSLVNSTDTIDSVNSTNPVTLTLPLRSTLQIGQMLHFKDSGGHAATAPITVAATSTDLIDGQTSTVINTNYGFVSLINGAGGWEIGW